MKKLMYPTKKVALNLKADLVRKAKIHAAKTDKTLTQVLNELIEGGLKGK